MDRKETVQAAMVHLLKQGFVSLPVLLFTEYKRLGLTETEAMLLIHLYIFQEKENKTFPTVAELEERMSLSQHQIVDLIQRLLHGGFIRIEEGHEHGIRSESYELTPLFQQLVSSYLDHKQKKPESDGETYQQIFRVFELEFGRALSPMECQMLSQWIDEDGYSEEIIEAALREAVFCGKVNFRYIDRILLEWHKNNVRTADEAAEYSRKFRQKGSLYQTNVKEKPVLSENGFSFYNWVNQE